MGDPLAHESVSVFWGFKKKKKSIVCIVGMATMVEQGNKKAFPAQEFTLLATLKCSTVMAAKSKSCVRFKFSNCIISLNT